MPGEPSSPSGDQRADESAPAAEARPGFGDLRHYVPPDLLNASFPVAVRGYDRAAVESYVKRANRVIAELKVSSSPRAAVTHALEQTEQQVSGLLQRARETGEEITASARQEAEEIIAKAKTEAADLHVNVSTEADGIKAEADQVLAAARTEGETPPGAGRGADGDTGEGRREDARASGRHRPRPR
jgi:vacuolar-type H+-ATPase subunit H